MSLQTPESIRRLQRKLYLKAKVEPAFRFYLLYDKICREDILRHAYDLARANRGAPGVDGVTFAAIEAAGLEGWLGGLRKDVVAKTYRPEPVRRVMIPKPGGGERPLGIPTIRDRVVQTAAKLVLEPIFEADLDPAAYGADARHQTLQSRSSLRHARGIPSPACASWPAAACFEMKPVGKPDAGNPHVRFDERGGETERLDALDADTAPFLDFTDGAGWRASIRAGATSA